MQVNDSAHFGISADLTLVARAVVQADIFDFQNPIMRTIIVHGGESWVADVSVPAGGEDFVLPGSQPGDLRAVQIG